MSDVKIERRIFGNPDPDGYIGDKSFKDYEKSVRELQDKADKDGGDTAVNYLPYMNGVILRAESEVPKSAVLSDNPANVFKQALGFKMSVAGYGNLVRGLNIGDTVDIKSTEGMTLRTFIPDNNNVVQWREKLKGDKESMMRHNLGIAEDPGKVGSISPVLDAAGKEIKSDEPIKLHEETVLIVEYFATEDHNLLSIYKILENVRPSK